TTPLGCAAAPASARRASPRWASWAWTWGTASIGPIFSAGPPRAGNCTSNSATSSDAHFSGAKYDARPRGLPDPRRRRFARRPDSHAPGHGLVAGQDRLRELPDDHAVDPRVRGGRFGAQPRHPGGPGRDRAPAGADGFGGPRLRSAVDRPLARREAGEATRAAAAAGAVHAARQRAQRPHPATATGAVRPDRSE